MSHPGRDENWSEVVKADAALYEARRRFMAGPNVAAQLRCALARATDRGAALRVLASLDVVVVMDMAQDLVRLASVAHSDITLVRQVLARVPAAWREAYLWDYVEPLLLQGDAEEFRRLAELLRELDSVHLQRLVSLARERNDEDIKEVAEDFGA